jgi:uncharacterized membrane protein
MTIFKDTTGFIHLVSAITALIFGTLVLLRTKGTNSHKLLGYAYTLSMTILLVTSFNLYHLFGRWGIFHYAAALSTITLVAGFVPAFFRIKNWLQWHVTSMYYSVIGLYAALVSEVVTRVPGLPFFPMVMGGTAFVMVVAFAAFARNRAKWLGHRTPLTPTPDRRPVTGKSANP